MVRWPCATELGYWFLGSVFELFLERCLSLCGERGPDEAVIEEHFNDFEIPFGLAWLDVDDGAGGGAFDGVRSELADVPYIVETFDEVGREIPGGDNFFNLVVEVPLLCSELILKDRLQAPPAECGAGLRAVGEDNAGFGEVLSVRVRNLFCYRPCARSGICHEIEVFPLSPPGGRGCPFEPDYALVALWTSLVEDDPVERRGDGLVRTVVHDCVGHGGDRCEPFINGDAAVRAFHSSA